MAAAKGGCIVRATRPITTPFDAMREGVRSAHPAPGTKRGSHYRQAVKGAAANSHHPYDLTPS